MSLRLALKVISGDYPKMVQDEQQRMAQAASAAMKDAAALAKSTGRASIAAGGFGAKWQNALRAKVFPENGASLKPAAFIYHKIPYAGVFEEGATISGKPMLWLPLDNVPIGSGGRRMTPEQFVAKVGVLYSINRPGKPPMLGAVVKATDARLATKGISLSLLRRGRNPKGRGSVRIIPIFVGVPTVTDPRKFEIKGAVQEAADQLGALYAKNFKE